MDYISILISIRKILRSINLESKSVQKQYGLSIPQYLCLNFLNQQEDYRSTSTEIKKHLDLNASTVTGIISRLESKGFIAKLPNQGDKRSVFIYLTALGEKKVKDIPPLLHEKLTRKLKNMSKDDLAQLQKGLDLLVRFMEVEKVDASPLISSETDILN